MLSKFYGFIYISVVVQCLHFGFLCVVASLK